MAKVTKDSEYAKKFCDKEVVGRLSSLPTSITKSMAGSRAIVAGMRKSPDASVECSIWRFVLMSVSHGTDSFALLAKACAPIPAECL